MIETFFESPLAVISVPIYFYTLIVFITKCMTVDLLKTRPKYYSLKMIVLALFLLLIFLPLYMLIIFYIRRLNSEILMYALYVISVICLWGLLSNLYDVIFFVLQITLYFFKVFINFL